MKLIKAPRKLLIYSNYSYECYASNYVVICDLSLLSQEEEHLQEKVQQITLALGSKDKKVTASSYRALPKLVMY